jgi:amino acid transporter
MPSQKAHLIKVEAQLRKAYRRAIFCGVLIVMAMMLIVMVPMIAGQPVDQKAVAESALPFIIFMAAIAGLCHFLHSGVKAKIKRLEQ